MARCSLARHKPHSQMVGSSARLGRKLISDPVARSLAGAQAPCWSDDPWARAGGPDLASGPRMPDNGERSRSALRYPQERDGGTHPEASRQNRLIRRRLYYTVTLASSYLESKTCATGKCNSRLPGCVQICMCVCLFIHYENASTWVLSAHWFSEITYRRA
jgi:hypothetical protein